jgi:hypothetical protein
LFLLHKSAIIFSKQYRQKAVFARGIALSKNTNFRFSRPVLPLAAATLFV